MTVPHDDRFRLYLDEDSQDWVMVRAFVEAGVDVVTSNDAGMAESSDEQQVAFAAAHERVILTANIKDYRRLCRDRQAAGGSHPGLILRRQDLGVGEQIRRVVRMWETVSASGMVDREEFLSAWGKEQG